MHYLQTSPEWTCVVVGLSSGFVNFYNHNGHLLHAQRFYEEPVSGLRAQSGRNVEELVTVQYRRCVAIIQGAQLFPLLRGFVTAKKQSQQSDNKQSPTKIPCQKWMYDSQCGEIVDSVVIGGQRGCAFDHLLSTCLEDGVNAHYKATRPQTSLVLTTGTRPFVGFQYAREGFNATELADAAKAVARLLKSALPSWLSSGGNSKRDREQQEQAHSPPPPIMACKFGVCDSQRNAYSVWVSPNKSLAAVSDNLGRIVVVDCHRATVVRMFKGYREPQCGFLEVKHDGKGGINYSNSNKNSNNNKQKGLSVGVSSLAKLRATFLVIYAPRRGIIEVWPMQKGQRVGAFAAPKNGQLLYNVHTLMGVASGSKVKFKGSPCVFFDPAEETFKEIVIPFHLALSGSNSEIAKDMHLLKRLKQIIRGASGDAVELERTRRGIEELVPQIQSVDFRVECLELAATAKKTCPEIVRATVEAMRGVLKRDSDEDDKVGIMCENYARLVQFYEYIVQREDKCERNEPVDKIQLNDMELLNIQKLIDLSTLTTTTQDHQPKGKRKGITFADQQEQGQVEQSSGKVTFDERGVRDNKFVTFLAVFTVDQRDRIALHGDKPEQTAIVGELIFQSFLDLNHPWKDFAKVCLETRIASESLVRLLLAYWLARPFAYTKFEELILDLTRFTGILSEICVVAGSHVDSDYNAICPWWQEVREFLLENPNSMRSLLAALMCRNMCLRAKAHEPGTVTEDTAFEDGFENMSQEACHWNLIAGKLDDVSVLGAILNNKMRADAEVYPKLRPAIPTISLRMILSGGRGVISELVAKWLTGTGIDPHLILEAVETPKEEDAREGSSSTTSNLKDYQLTSGDLGMDKPLKDTARDARLEPILNSLQIMRGNFPFSLQSSKVLANMGWEYLSHWSKNLALLEYLEAGINCLDLIREKAIRQAMCAMVWRVNLRIPLEACKKLIFKAGKLPREKLCLQDVGLSDAVMSEFLDKCEKFLLIYLQSCCLELVVIKYEDTLREGPAQPLIEMALKSAPAVLEVLEVHLELVKILHLVAHFNFKFTKQLSGLFDTTGNQLMFSEMGAPPKDAIVVTEHIRRYRLEFLNRVITAAMELIRWDDEAEQVVYLADYEHWMRRIHKLADEWRVDRAKMSVHTVSDYILFWRDV